ncbi:MAG: hypothetical protein LC733_06435, partial [Actinobacteria bacterium]|nr:hypothetical protein [Actinomycetota bacterium]
ILSATGTHTDNTVIPVRDYAESGKAGTRTFTLDLAAMETGIVGGYIVDGRARGVYKMICGPGTFTTTVTDGFSVIVPSDMARAAFARYLNEATQHGWAQDHVSRC